ncbi:MAG: hypothetical protein AB1758_06190 [Candidatus Eremiobacterota bacterium]
MNKTLWIRWGGAMVVATALFWGSVASTRAQASDPPGQLEQALGGRLGVVDYDSLLQAHPDYERLEQFDQQLSLLTQQRDWLPVAERQGKADQARDRMKAAYEKAREEMESEQARIQAELSGMSDHLAAQLQAEGNRLKEQMDRELQAFIQQHQPQTPQSLPDSLPGKDEYLKNLALLRERENTARALEINKAKADRINAEQARIDSELAAYVDEIMRQNQQEKLNLQLQVSVAKDEAEQAALEERLSALSEQEEQLKQAKRAELRSQFEAVQAEEEARAARELSAAKARVDAEVQAKLANYRPQGTAAPPPQMSPELTAEVQRKIREKQAELQAIMERRQTEFKARMEAESAAAVARLKQKQQEIEERLGALGKELKSAMEADEKDLSPEVQARLKSLDEQIDKLKAQRQELYDTMVADLKGEIQKVAEKQKVDMVVGLYVHNQSCEDLTDRSMVQVRMMQTSR